MGNWAAASKPCLNQTLLRDRPKQIAVLPGTSQPMILAAPSSRKFLVTRTKHSPTELHFQVRENWAENQTLRGPLGSSAPSGAHARASKRPLLWSDQVQESRPSNVCSNYTGKWRPQAPGSRSQATRGCPEGDPCPQLCHAPSQRRGGPCLSLPVSLHPSYSEKTSSPRDQTEPSLLINPS